MYYTLEGIWKMKRLRSLFLGLTLAFVVASCASAPTPGPVDPTAVQAVATPTDRAPVTNQVPPASLPQICNCVLHFDNISIEQGLSQSSVKAIFQDSRGFLWFGTEDGLNRYDGYSFKTFKPEPSNSNSLSDGWITDIVEDQNGYLWIGTRLGGLNRYDPFNGQFIQYQHLDEQPHTLNDNHITSLLVDRDNRDRKSVV